MTSSFKIKALACVLIFGGFVFYSCLMLDNIVSSPAKESAAKATVRQIIHFMLQYFKSHDRWPVNVDNGSLACINEITVSIDDSCVYNEIQKYFIGDSWGNQLFVSVLSNRLTVISAGPDGITNTTDDIIGWTTSDRLDSESDDAAITIVGEKCTQ